MNNINECCYVKLLISRVSHPGQENCVDNGPHYDRCLFENTCFCFSETDFLYEVEFHPDSF